MVRSDELADGIMIMGVRETRLVGPVEGRGWARAAFGGAPGAGAAGFRG